MLQKIVIVTATLNKVLVLTALNNPRLTHLAFSHSLFKKLFTFLLSFLILAVVLLVVGRRAYVAAMKISATIFQPQLCC